MGSTPQQAITRGSFHNVRDLVTQVKFARKLYTLCVVAHEERHHDVLLIVEVIEFFGSLGIGSETHESINLFRCVRDIR